MENKEPAFIISEFGRRARIITGTLRFYEEVGVLIPAKQNSYGHIAFSIALKSFILMGPVWNQISGVSVPSEKCSLDGYIWIFMWKRINYW